MLKYLKFLLKSTNQHGVHSPFVYAYVTRGLYCGKKYRGPVHRRILFRTIAYFGAGSIHIAEASDERLSVFLKTCFPGIAINPAERPRITCYNKPLIPGEVSRFLSETDFKGDHILVLEKIHRNKTAEKTWEMVKENGKVVVTIDLFYAGIVFFREGQAREDFIIRP